MNELISVIIPVYNVEQYLSECVESVLRQNYAELEIILVDDGSTDLSGSMCNEYAAKYNRVKVIHQANGGLSAARNEGLKVATGQYVAFVDSDDVLLPNYFEMLSEMMCNDIGIASVSMQKFCKSAKSVDMKAKRKVKSFSALEAVEKILLQNELDTSACGKLFQKDLFFLDKVADSADMILFPEGKLYEDLATIYKLYLRAVKVVHCELPLYCYRQQENSILHKFSLRRADVLDITDEIEEFFSSDFSAQIFSAACDRKFSANMNILMLMTRTGICSQDLISRCWANICRLRSNSLSNSKVRLKNKLGALMSYGGLTLLQAVFRMTKIVVR